MAEPTGARIWVSPELLKSFCSRVYQSLGVPPEDADIVADTLVVANLRGVESHGVLRAGFYASKLKGGATKPVANLTTVKETAATALLDGQNGLGQVISFRAMQVALRKAQEAGMAYVAVRNSSHFGACAYYSMMALPHDMIGFCSTNAGPRLAPAGGVELMYGNNPFCIAVPAGEKLPLVLDMALSNAAVGKIRIALKEGKPIPEGWALNKFGEPTTDPQEALDGILQAVGGYKGYGMAVMVDMLTGVLSNSNYGRRVIGMQSVTEPPRNSHSFMAIDLAAFDEVPAFKARVDGYIQELKSSQKARGVEEILVPGEPEFFKERERREKGIPLQPRILEDLRELGKECGVPADF